MAQTQNEPRNELRVGAAVVDVTPLQLPVLVNGGMLSRTADAIKTRVNSRAVVLDDGNERIAMVVVDSCMVPRQLLDEAKQLASQKTSLRPDRIMISATHTHTAPSSFGALGTSADPTYVPFLRQRIAESIVAAESRLQPARVGWGSVDASEFTALRRWVRRPDRIDLDPFENPTVRANMHAARNRDDVTGESGPEDPELSIIAFETIDGVPIAAIANFSMHYFGDQPISADYFGLFCDALADHVSTKHATDDFVAVMSHGCSGDIWRRDYMKWSAEQPQNITIENYTQQLAQVAIKTLDGIQYEPGATLAMAEARVPMKYRVPDAQRLQWAQQIVDQMESDIPKDRREVYAREQVLLHQLQETEIVLQAIRIGNIAIATTPNETYALTGLKLKLQSPLDRTMVIELANGADGYIPPPEQHHLGGYNTWAARSAGLEVTAEPRIVATDLTLLEQVTGQPRRRFVESSGPDAERMLQSNPVAYWRMADMERPIALDATPNQHHGFYELGTCFFLPSAARGAFTDEGSINRCVHFAGGRMRAHVDLPADRYRVRMSFWNGMPNDAREVTGWMFSRDHPHALSHRGDHLGIAGTGDHAGCLMFQHGMDPPVVGSTIIDRWSWNDVELVRHGNRVQVFLNDSKQPEIDTTVEPSDVPIATLFIGGRSDNQDNWEGRIDEVAIFDSDER